MKVIAFNGSPNKKGNTYKSLKIVCDVLEANGIETEIINIGTQNFSGYHSCFSCVRNQDGKCAFNPEIEQYINMLHEADGMIVASPVHYAGIAGNMKCFLDTLMFSNSRASTNALRHKVGAAVVNVRRSGGVTTFDQLNNFLNYNEMFMASSNYWNVIHGAADKGEVSDLEGVQILEVLGANMSHLLKVLDQSNISKPVKHDKVFTNFVREDLAIE